MNFNLKYELWMTVRRREWKIQRQTQTDAPFFSVHIVLINKWSGFGLDAGIGSIYLLFEVIEYDRCYNIYFKIVEKLWLMAQDGGRVLNLGHLSPVPVLSAFFSPVISRTLNKRTFVPKYVKSLFRLFTEEGARREQKGTLLCIQL